VEETSRNSPRHDQALFVLGGWPHPDAQGIWHSSLFENGRIGDRLRVEAAAVLYRANPQLIIVTGGNEKLAHLPEVPACASVMRRELIELGLPAADIQQELKSANTYEQLQFIKTVFNQFPIATLRILSNRYHLPRIGAFLASDPHLEDWCTHGRIQMQAAEDALLQHNRFLWQDLIAEAYDSDAMRKRMQREEKGVRDIRAGTYSRWQ
jgi:hypothetical protein